MSEMQKEKRQGGIRLNRLNFSMICVGFLLAGLMIFGILRTRDRVSEMAAFTDNFLQFQSTGGMLNDISENQGSQAMAFVQSGEPGPANGYAGQMGALQAQLAGYTPSESKADELFLKAVEAYREKTAVEIRAMRLAAEDLPKPLFEALPEFLKNAELSEEDAALTAEARKGAALQLLTSEEYTGYAAAIRQGVDESHRISSEEGQEQARETSEQVQSIVQKQLIVVILFILVAAAALLLNRILIIHPIQKSVDNLDRREPIPERGGYEMRHLARVYNEVLKDNQEKAEALSYSATHDALTGLMNRAAFDRIYAETEKKKKAGILIADVDHFKQYNDDYGHDIGDRVLRMSAEALQRHFRAEDQICRIGGDEFCVIMPGMGQAQGPEISRRIGRINEELRESAGDLPPITISAGAAFWDRPDPKGSLFKDADSALLEIKKSRNTCCAVYPAES